MLLRDVLISRHQTLKPLVALPNLHRTRYTIRMPDKPVALEFLVTLEHIEPAIWRRIRVPAKATMWDLHVAIQDAMGWMDSHLHQFVVGDRQDARFIGIPSDMDNLNTVPGWQVPAQEVFPMVGTKRLYEYDFGDGWEHSVALEDIVIGGTAIRRPRCLDGKRACPPEDCGGPHGYMELLQALSAPQHPEHATMKAWVPERFDPERFNPKWVIFDDPAWRLSRMMG